MKIKRRVFTGTQEASAAADDKNTFPVIEAKPKQPLPPATFEGINARALGTIAVSCREETGDTLPDAGFTAGDYVRNLRTPYDERDATQVRYRNRVRNRATGIVAKCVDCVGSRKNVTECMAIECPLWAFRLGSNPFRRRK